MGRINRLIVTDVVNERLIQSTKQKEENYSLKFCRH